MLNVYTHNWWAIALRGVAAVIFGLLAFIMPGVTLITMVFLFAAYAIIEGAFAIAAGIRASQENNRWWLLLLEGIFSVIAGVLAFVLPGITAFFLLVLIAGWAIATGALEIVAAIQMRRYITGEWMMILSGLASVFFGVLLLVNPGAGALAVVWIIGSYAVVFGILLLALGFKLRGLERATHHPATPHPA